MKKEKLNKHVKLNQDVIDYGDRTIEFMRFYSDGLNLSVSRIIKLVEFEMSNIDKLFSVDPATDDSSVYNAHQVLVPCNMSSRTGEQNTLLGQKTSHAVDIGVLAATCTVNDKLKCILYMLNDLYNDHDAVWDDVVLNLKTVLKRYGK